MGKTMNYMQSDSTHRLIVMGANGVGKTSLVTTFFGKDGNKEISCMKKSRNGNKVWSNDSFTSFYEANICLSIESPTSNFRIVHFEIQIIDDLDGVVFNVDNDVKSLKITPKMFDGCLCVFDISQKCTFDICTKLRENILRLCVSIFLVPN